MEAMEKSPKGGPRRARKGPQREPWGAREGEKGMGGRRNQRMGAPKKAPGSPKEDRWEPGNRRDLKGTLRKLGKELQTGLLGGLGRGSKWTPGESGKRKRGMGRGRRNQIMGVPMKAPESLESDPGRDLKGTPRNLEKELQRGLSEGLGWGSKGTGGETGKRKRRMGKGRRNQIMGAPMKASW
jgi:hypothetical protein